MPNRLRAGAAALFLSAVCASALQGQASPYVPLDDPDLPLVEHLIARGDLRDPSPMQRPFRRADLRRVLAEADSTATGATAELIARLTDRYRDPTDESWWRLTGRAGAQGYSNSRRDVWQPQGPSGVRPYADLGLTAVFGPVALASRPALEPRVVADPAWLGRQNLDVAFRMVEASVSAQFRWFDITFGDVQRNWGPVGLPGIPLSDYGYPRTSWAFSVGSTRLRLDAVGAGLRDERDDAGAVVHRHFFAHRLGWQAHSRLFLAVWETTVLAGVDQEFLDRFRNPVSVLLLANTYGRSAEGNTMVGLDASWRVPRSLTLELQLAIDDLQYQNRSGPDRFPDRWAVTLGAHGPLGERLAWRALVTRATSLAFRTASPFESFTDGGVGLGRNFADNDRAFVSVSVPVAGRWLVAPMVGIWRQGEGRITDSLPPNPGDVPQIFIGTVSKTVRGAVQVSGRQGPLALSADLGVNHVIDADHQAGRSETAFEGHLQVTMGFSLQGGSP